MLFYIMLVLRLLAGIHRPGLAHTDAKITMKHLVRPDDQRLE